jgi:hypothetical protein
VALNGALGSLEAYKQTSTVRFHFLSDAPFWTQKLPGERVLTKADLFVESNTGRSLLGDEFFGIKENTFLFLESSLSLQRMGLTFCVVYSPECLSSVE